MAGIFISYRRDDSAAITGRIFDRLSAHFGPDQVFMDIDSIPVGQDFRDHIGQTLARCEVMLAVVGPEWTGPVPNQERRRIDDPADLVRLELEGGLARQIPVVPVLVEGAVTPSPLQLPESLRGFSYRNAAKVDSGKDFHPHVDRLIRDLEALLDRQGAGAAPAAPAPAQAAPRPAAPAETPVRESAGRAALWPWLAALLVIAAVGFALFFPQARSGTEALAPYFGIVAVEPLLVVAQWGLGQAAGRRTGFPSRAAPPTHGLFLLATALFVFSIVLGETDGQGDARQVSDALAWVALVSTALGVASLLWQALRGSGRERR